MHARERADLPFRCGRKALTFIHARSHSSTGLYLPKWVMTIPRRLWNFDFLLAALYGPGRLGACVLYLRMKYTRWHRFYILLAKLPYPIPCLGVAWRLPGFIWCDAGRIQRIYIGKPSRYPPIDCKWKIVLLGTNRVRVWCGGSDPLLGAARRNFILRCVALWIMPLLC